MFKKDKGFLCISLKVNDNDKPMTATLLLLTLNKYLSNFKQLLTLNR